MGATSGLAVLLSAGVVGRTYLALRDGEPDAESTDEETEDDDADPYDAPLGPDDLPEPE
jgi:putative intracellular protease/amidase